MKLFTAPRSNQEAAATTFAPATFVRAALFGLIATVATVGSALAQELPSVKAKQTDGQRLAFTIENPNKKALQMRVLNLDDNTCLVNEINRKPSYGCSLDFQGLPAGRYAVLMRVGRENYRYNVQVQRQPQTTISVPGLSSPEAPSTVAALAQ